MSLDLDKIWISHSAISDFEKCPRLYYLKNLYRDPQTNHRIQVVDPYLTLGSVVHKTIEKIAKFPIKERQEVSLIEDFEKNWQSAAGKRGGFDCLEKEEIFKKRGMEMVKKFENSEVIKKENYIYGEKLPKVRLFKNDNLILIGNIDWIEILDSGGFHIIDFKTGKNEENKNSLQLPIYQILAHYNFKKPIEKISYWYLDKDDKPISMEFNSLKDYIAVVRKKALEIKQAIKNNYLFCKSSKGKCFRCEKYGLVASHYGEYLGYDLEMNKDLYFI